MLTLPQNVPSVKDWVILSTDLSLSRSGMWIGTFIDGSLKAEFIGSIKSESSDPQWVRCYSSSWFLKKKLDEISSQIPGRELGLLVVSEVPTPGNDYLGAIHSIVNASLLPWSEECGRFKEIWNLRINAATMRNILGLVQKGSDNKKENQALAWTFFDPKEFPGLDTDACDAALFAVLASWTIKLFSEESVPDNFKTRFLDSTLVAKGKGKNAYTTPRGVLLNEEYWSRHVKSSRQLTIKDARIPPRKRLEKVSYPI